ncbi:molybdenum cofactor biosynthesis protein MoaE [Pengzhenrongella frigida]|uniref:Molybdenum cofactor biosynthesis protein MoaE n=1 Tax=Pengzhenrongella frigida TaxID=1259133 RepID=A0A4Q5N3G2_9MICO|nr:molybdenum cofactor biosynthesis protein MoaE [Cellulomonas sp. HLT2-17]RYV51157.1 molybdenum cofactor biosynthesis protein MoaE [Cellulomonas sp. HLT2-17]
MPTPRPAPSSGADPGAVPGAGARPVGSRDTSRILPPARVVVRASVTSDVIDPAEHAVEVARSTAGAVVTFSGAVRDHDGGRGVLRIEYVAHPSAGEILARVAGEVAARTEVDALAVSHRLGELAIGDCALAVAVSAAHRAEAFAAAALLVDEVKRQLPVWKRQVFADGTDEWVDCP